LYILRGLARLDAVKECKIEKLRRVHGLPDDARESIQAYLNRIAARSDEREPAGGDN
jgi:hypothetical protein